MIKEIIVVEGRDDEAAVKRSVEAETIATHGFGIKKETFDLIEKAYQDRGIIIFTDPDFAGEKIRKRLTERFPFSKQAYLLRGEAERDGDIGIENANTENIKEALMKARCNSISIKALFTMEDMIRYGLCGEAGAAEKRDKLGKSLGIGYGNSKIFLNRLNQYGITKQEFIASLKNLTT